LEREKLAQEVQQLQRANEGSTGAFWQRVGSFTTLFLAILGAFVTLWKQIDEQRNGRREKLAAKFTDLVTDLGSEQLPVRAGAAVGLLTFLRAEYKEYQEQVFLTLIANLRLQEDPVVKRLLVRAFEQALPLWLRTAMRHRQTVDLDLAHCHLSRVDLSKALEEGLDMSGIRALDLKETQLEGANLEGLRLAGALGLRVNLDHARLEGADLTEARFHEAHLNRARLNKARLVSAKLRGADLREARLQQAQLQSAHLDGARLAGALFAQADLNDTFFCGAHFDDTALLGILRAKNWRFAHFDEKDRARLELLEKKQEKKRKQAA
jgi:uncharacterized protein YjbI with pentapeptide repeats